MKRLKLVLLIILGIGVIGGGFGAYHYHTKRVEQAQQQKIAAKKAQARRTAQKQRVIAKKIKAATFSKTKNANAQITKILKTSQFVGTALVVKNNQVIYQRGFGYANKAKETLNGPTSKYQILSIQKSITAVGIMRLVQAGKLKLTDPVNKYYPTIKGGTTTIRQLLDMTTGFRLKDGSTDTLDEQQVVDYAVKHLTFTPEKLGTFNYSSVNFLLLAGIIRQITGQSYKTFFNQQIIKKLDLHQTGFVINGQGKGATTGYQAVTGQMTPTYATKAPETTAQMANELGTGQVYMSAGDLFKTERAIVDGQLLTPKNVAILHKRTATGTYGGGVYNDQPTALRSHGVGYGYESGIRLSKDGKNGVVLLSNYYRSTDTLLTAMNKIYQEMMRGNLK
ncbi:peptidase S12 [Lactobacillus sp. CBA3605]|uniref:serine hydrolase domain-containing protein n=1 Tax=Lactobacillus sp. CBA3605 TaxID=2099788 RepID=UPI000CFB8F9E|nr:serine hydrolase domain-containing protein [Lactobacillus sp. CBA3605]AVK60486.1 peptidase S12 [Lactobacillus sp. CBA3605]